MKSGFLMLGKAPKWWNATTWKKKAIRYKQIKFSKWKGGEAGGEIACAATSTHCKLFHWCINHFFSSYFFVFLAQGNNVNTCTSTRVKYYKRMWFESNGTSILKLYLFEYKMIIGKRKGREGRSHKVDKHSASEGISEDRENILS